MKALLSALSLLVALAIVATLAARHLRTSSIAPPVPPSGASAPVGGLPEQVRRDVTKALEQGAQRPEPDL